MFIEIRKCVSSLLQNNIDTTQTKNIFIINEILNNDETYS